MSDTQNAGFVGALATGAAAAPAAAPAGAPPGVVDFDSGGSWGAETIPLTHPFKLRGVVYAGVVVSVPSGIDVTRFYQAAERPSVVDFAIGLLKDTAGAPLDAVVFGRMHASDAAAIVAKASGFLAAAR
jgi:hypothetical protein